MRIRLLVACSCLSLAALPLSAQSTGGGGGGGSGGAAAGGGGASAGSSAGAGGTTGVAGSARNTTAGTANGPSVNTRWGVNTGSRNGTTVNAPQTGSLPPSSGVQRSQVGQGQPIQGQPQPSQYGTQNQFWTQPQDAAGVVDTGVVNEGVVPATQPSQPAAVPPVVPNPTAQPQAPPPTSNRTETRTYQAPQTQETGDKAYTAADQSLLIQLREEVLPVVRGSSTGISPVHFSIRHGVVTLWGDVPTSDIRQQVVDKVQGATGVVQVIDQITVGSQAQGAPAVYNRTAADTTGSGNTSVPTTKSRQDNISPDGAGVRSSQATSNTFGGSYSAPFSVGTAGTNLVTADQIRGESELPER